jgi:hypothetical protein
MMFLTEQKNKETILYPYGGEWVLLIILSIIFTVFTVCLSSSTLIVNELRFRMRVNMQQSLDLDNYQSVPESLKDLRLYEKRPETVPDNDRHHPAVIYNFGLSQLSLYIYL